MLPRHQRLSKGNPGDTWVGVGLLALQAAAFRAYAGIMEMNGNPEEAAV